MSFPWSISTYQSDKGTYDTAWGLLRVLTCEKGVCSMQRTEEVQYIASESCLAAGQGILAAVILSVLPLSGACVSLASNLRVGAPVREKAPIVWSLLSAFITAVLFSLASMLWYTKCDSSLHGSIDSSQYGT